MTSSRYFSAPIHQQHQSTVNTAPVSIRPYSPPGPPELQPDLLTCEPVYQGLPAQRPPRGSAHPGLCCRQPGPWSTQCDYFHLPMAHRPALAQADQSRSVPRGLGRLLHRSMSNTSPQRPESGWGRSPSTVPQPQSSSSFSTASLSSRLRLPCREGALFTFPLWFLPA